VTLWHGRFGDAPADELLAFTVSLPFDQRLATDDLACSRAHVRGLERGGILTEAELAAILEALDQVADRLGRTGLDVVLDEGGASGRARVVVAGVDDVTAAVLAAPGVPLVAVRSGEDSDRIGLDERVDRLVARPVSPDTH